MVTKNVSKNSSQRLDLTCVAKAVIFLTSMRDVEKVGRITRRLVMLIVLLDHDMVFVAAARVHRCDRRTVAMWYRRLHNCDGSISGIRRALSDKPRSGRPTSIKKEILNQARRWCEETGSVTPQQLQDKLKKMSGTKLGIAQVRRYMRDWGFSRKKTQPVHIRQATMNAVRSWRRRLFAKIRRYERLGYAVVTMDEAHFMDAALSAKFWSKKGMRILLEWSGGHRRFSMLCSMSKDGQFQFDHCSKVDTAAFLQHIKKMHDKVGKMVLVMDKASYHKYAEALAFFKEYDIIPVWYPTGHPYLNPVENVWGVMKNAIEQSVRYADLKTHLNAAYKFIGDGSRFDYDFTQFWNRKPPKSVRRPYIKPDEGLHPAVEANRVGPRRAAKRKK